MDALLAVVDHRPVLMLVLLLMTVALVIASSAIAVDALVVWSEREDR